MSFDTDSGFESDFGNDPEGFSDFAEDWNSDGAVWSDDGDGPAEVLVTNPMDFHDDGHYALERDDHFPDDGGGDGDGWAAPYGPDGPVDHDDLHALSEEWMNGGRESWGEPTYVPDEWDNEPREEAAALEAEKLEAQADAFPFADEQGDPEDEKDSNDEHNGFFGRWLG